ncbi:MAG: TlpA disulfide reductase family protein [Bryobacterales bacterium]
MRSPRHPRRRARRRRLCRRHAASGRRSTFTPRTTARQFRSPTTRSKPVVIFFFSTDCPHCQRAASQMAPLYPELKKKGIEILGLAMNPTAKNNLNAFIKAHTVQFPAGVSSDKQFRAFANLTVMQNFYYPYMLFVDPAGQIREEHQGAERAWYGNFEFNLLKSIDNISAK